jgi:hypothetical protein
MRTTKRLLIVAVALALPIAMASWAVAAPGGNPSKKPVPTTTSLPDEPPPPAEEPVCETVNLLPFERTWVQFDCAWTPDDDGSPIGTVGVEADGEVVYLVIAVRDSSPGDYCLDPVIWDGKGLGTHFEASFDLVRGIESYWLHPTNWCGDREDLNGDPLTVTVNARVKRNTDLTVTLDPSQIP